MTNLSVDDVLGLIRDVDGDPDSDLSSSHAVTTGDDPTHIIWGGGTSGG